MDGHGRGVLPLLRAAIPAPVDAARREGSRVVRRIASRYKGLDRYFRTGSKAGIQPKHPARLPRGHWAVWVDENWRLTFKFEGDDAVLVNYRDYH